MRLLTPLAPAILFLYFVKRLRRAPRDTTLPRRSKFYDSSGQEWDLEIPTEAETNELSVIWAVVAGMESLAA